MNGAILLLSAADTDLLAARASGGPWRLANRGLWAEPPPEVIEQPQAAYLELEGELEGKEP
jgi:hypothetical protein